MDDKLKNALEFANYSHTLHNQKQLIKQKFIDDCVFYHNAGKFTVNRELLVYCGYCQQWNRNIPVILLDDNNIPIEIKDIDKFTIDILKLYKKSSEEYHNAYQKLVGNKTVKGLIDE